MAVPHCVAQTPQAPPKYSATVQLVVKSDDDALRSQVTSFLSRELRSLGDITIVDEKPFFLINVLVYKTHDMGGATIGFAMATHISRPLNASVLTDCAHFPAACLAGRVDDLRLQVLKVFIGDAAVTRDFDLTIGPLDQVQQTCQAIVADFDTKIVDEFRKLLSQMIETYQKARDD